MRFRFNTPSGKECSTASFKHIGSFVRGPAVGTAAFIASDYLPTLEVSASGAAKRPGIIALAAGNHSGLSTFDTSNLARRFSMAPGPGAVGSDDSPA